MYPINVGEMASSRLLDHSASYPPPVLDCGEIAYTNFTVLAPDPHKFDGDKDGVECEMRIG